MMVDFYQHFDQPLAHRMLHSWHEKVMRGHHNIRVVGAYRIHTEPMQIVSGYMHKPTVHFEAPPSSDVKAEMMAFIIAKTRMWDRLSGELNPRQQKVMGRLFAAGLKGFEGGLSARNYISITGTTTATATRDLTDLVQKQALIKTGQIKGTRYWLNIPVCIGRT